MSSPTNAVSTENPRAKTGRIRDVLTRGNGRVPMLQLVMLATLIILGASLIPGFTRLNSVYSMLIIASFLGLAALGQTLVVLLGGLDLSVPAFIVLSAMLTSELHGTYGWPFPAIAAFIVLVSLVVGGISGYLSHKYRVQPLIVTLGVGTVVTGATLIWIGGKQPGSAPAFLSNFVSPVGTTFGLKIPPAVVLWCLLAVGIGFILRHTKFGKSLYATGSSIRAAELALVPTRRIWVSAFSLSALFAAVVGALLAGFSGSADLTMGDPYLFQSLTAVIVGGTAFGARGDYWHTFIGALLLTVLSTILIGVGFSSSDQTIIYGILILVVVAGYSRDRALRDRV
ncbi:ABC transporter permease [Arthrobacter nitrophenolicus]|uniref:ABC transporter permease n=1 Tax=Arthrobacter nitrophenolicus TaxID=683150 RepID=A0A4R5XSX8_9MICC|nr:ABC transporter permease [Arthrobacter nitrophenolicus]TDL33986.1 ABC transporter permease [Arthrobacter nitrophenolicus]